MRRNGKRNKRWHRKKGEPTMGKEEQIKIGDNFTLHKTRKIQPDVEERIACGKVNATLVDS